VKREGRRLKAGEIGKAWLLVVALGVSGAAAGQNPAASGVPRNQARRWVLVSIPDRKLAVVEDGRVIQVFAVAVGATTSPSPAGEFHIIHRVANPTYYHPGLVIPPGPENPVGTRWVGLSRRGYGIHGTNKPGSIGKARSHGCIRMTNRDIERFFGMVQVGDPVEIRAERNDEVAHIFGGRAETNAATVAETSATGGEASGGQ
jgi:lipoprotein-anchoring transpeptidase ErfK/SrfK